jgi:hypothetical protein
MTRLRSFAFAALAAATAVGCAAHGPKPEARIVSTEGAIRGAMEAGAGSVPQGALHLRLAEEQRAAANTAMANGDNEAATLLLARAEADAEVAIALAREAAAEREAARANEQIRDLNRQVTP